MLDHVPAYGSALYTLKLPRARPPWGTSAHSHSPRDRLEVPFAPFGRPLAQFSRFLAAPRPIKKSAIFPPPPKSTQGVKKSTQGRPRVDFSWIFIDFGDLFDIIFLTFSEKAKIIQTLAGCSRTWLLPLQAIHFPIIFPSLFQSFSGTPPGTTFSRFYVDFWQKSEILDPWRPSWGLKIDPWGDHFGQKVDF